MTPSPQSRRSFITSVAALAAGAPFGTLQAATRAKRPLVAYVGTYSSPLPLVRAGQVDLPPGNGKGIHVFHVDRDTGALTPKGIYETTTSPTCLTYNAAGTCLYATDATALVDGETGTVSAYAIDRTDGRLTLLNTVHSGGAGPTYVSLHPNGRFLLVANYFGGSIAVLPILPDGGLGPAVDVKKHSGKHGPKTATNAPPGSFAKSGHDVPHAHMIQTDPAGHYVIVPDLGLDQIFIWKFDDQKGRLTPNDPASIPFPPGDGPRHFVFHPNGRWFYSLQEEGPNIVLLDYNAEKGLLTPRQTISCLPPGFAGSSFSAEILISGDGRFVYASNRLHDSISIFAVGANGELTFTGEEWTRGDYPRTFNFDPTGNFVYSCNQRGDNVTTFRVDKKTGSLAFTGQYTPVGNPAIIVFLDLGHDP